MNAIIFVVFALMIHSRAEFFYYAPEPQPTFDIFPNFNLFQQTVPRSIFRGFAYHTTYEDGANVKQFFLTGPIDDRLLGKSTNPSSNSIEQFFRSPSLSGFENFYTVVQNFDPRSGFPASTSLLSTTESTTLRKEASESVVKSNRIQDNAVGSENEIVKKVQNKALTDTDAETTTVEVDLDQTSTTEVATENTEQTETP